MDDITGFRHNSSTKYLGTPIECSISQRYTTKRCNVESIDKRNYYKNEAKKLFSVDAPNPAQIREAKGLCYLKWYGNKTAQSVVSIQEGRSEKES